MTSQYKQLFLKILERYRLGKASYDEITFLEKYYNLFETDEDVVLTVEEYSLIKNAIKAKVDRKIALLSKHKPARRLWPSWAKYSAVAAVFLVISTSILVFRNHQLNGKYALTAADDLEPGGHRAILTLANGKKIILDTAGTGEIASESGITVTKTKDGQLVYTVANVSGDDGGIVSNTITTPNGGNYQVILPDGTDVILNAASSLTFPTSFKGAERAVTLDGEAYFEVTKNEAFPFKVESGKQTVEVLGTHFNINAYHDEPIVKTTLLEGSVKVHSGTAHALIKPGQQTLVTWTDVNHINTREADLDKEMAWKNGAFSFDNDDLKSVMRQIARWYDAEVIYEGEFPNDTFIGGISRNSKLSQVAQILALNNINLKIIGKTIRVSYKTPAP
ncbi:MAG: FecR domain-containing protein [Pedobacter sp.]